MTDEDFKKHFREQIEGLKKDILDYYENMNFNPAVNVGDKELTTVSFTKEDFKQLKKQGSEYLILTDSCTDEDLKLLREQGVKFKYLGGK